MYSFFRNNSGKKNLKFLEKPLSTVPNGLISLEVKNRFKKEGANIVRESTMFASFSIQQTNYGSMGMY